MRGMLLLRLLSLSPEERGEIVMKLSHKGGKQVEGVIFKGEGGGGDVRSRQGRKGRGPNYKAVR